MNRKQVEIEWAHGLRIRHHIGQRAAQRTVLLALPVDNVGERGFLYRNLHISSYSLPFTIEINSNKKLISANSAFSTDVDNKPDRHVMVERGELGLESGQRWRYGMIFCARGIIMDAKKSNRNAALTHAQVLYVK